MTPNPNCHGYAVIRRWISQKRYNIDSNKGILIAHALLDGVISNDLFSDFQRHGVSECRAESLRQLSVFVRHLGIIKESACIKLTYDVAYDGIAWHRLSEQEVCWRSWHSFTKFVITYSKMCQNPFLPANYTVLYLSLPRKRSPDGASPDWGCGHLIAAYYSCHSFITLHILSAPVVIE